MLMGVLINVLILLFCLWCIVRPSGIAHAMDALSGGTSKRIGETMWRVSGAIMLVIFVFVWIVALYRGTWP
jgi:hypothetical protein